MPAPAYSLVSRASLELVREHRLAWIARLLHDEIGPTLSGIGLRLSAWDGGSDEKRDLQSALDSAIETVRILQYLAHAQMAGRFGLRRAFELLPYCAAPDFKAGVAVSIEGVPDLQSQAAQDMFEAAAVEVARASLASSAVPLRVRLTGQGWTLGASGD